VLLTLLPLVSGVRAADVSTRALLDVLCRVLQDMNNLSLTEPRGRGEGRRNMHVEVLLSVSFALEQAQGRS